MLISGRRFDTFIIIIKRGIDLEAMESITERLIFEGRVARIHCVHLLVYGFDRSASVVDVNVAPLDMVLQRVNCIGEVVGQTPSLAEYVGDDY